MNRSEALAFLDSNLQKVAPKSQDFAASIVGKAKLGKATDKMWFWIEKLANDVQNPPPPPLTEDIGSLTAITKLFATAGQKLKWPKIILQNNDKEVQLSVAGERSKHAGAIHVKENAPYGQGEYWGKIKDGKFEASRTATPDGLVDLLKRFACDPAGVAAEHGKLTGRCCFCNKRLEDDRSTDMGYGPVCAKHWGLKWGEEVVSSIIPDDNKVFSAVTEGALKRAFCQLAINLSPENLSCDGELTARQVAVRKKAIDQKWTELEAKFGRKVDIDEAYSWTWGVS